MSNRLAALVAYGDSDSDSDEEKPPVKAATPTNQGLVSYGPQDAEDDEDAEKEENDHGKLKRPGPMDTVSSHPTPPRGSSSTGSTTTTTTTNTTTTTTTTALSGKAVVAERLTSRTDSRLSSPSTPLPPDHSAAADVANTPTASQSPRIQHPLEAMAIDEEQQELPGSDRETLRRQLLRPKPIPGVDNFGIPPEPEEECSPDLQAKIENFYNIKLTRGIHFNQSLMKNKNFRNPHIYQSLVQLVDLDETGSNFEQSLEFFDYKGYPPESFAAGLAAAQDRAQERLAMQQQAGTRTHLQFVHGSSQGTTGPASGVASATAAAHHQAALAAATGVAAKLAASYSHASHANSLAAGAGPTTAAAAPGTGRSGRRSKWDSGAPATTASSTVNEQTYKKPRH
ncbi:hypothetical protein DFQ26_008935 [Actinomortierella ambigua]|nr:hypothetical protein DFQ26_008935 [Actinomortierella ambigua]